MQSTFVDTRRATYHRTILRFSVCFCVVSILQGCGLEKPKSPQWAVDVRVPIANRHIDGPYLAAHAGSQYLRWQDDSGLVWSITAELDTFYVGDNLSISPPAASGKFPLGSINVGQGTILTSTIALEDVTPLSAGTVPDLSTEVESAFANAAEFDSIAGAGGLLHLEIENELGLAVDQLTVTLRTQSGLPIATVPVPGTVPAGTRGSVDHDLVNLSVGGDWVATLTFHTPGGTVLSAADKFIAIHASFPDGLSAEYARSTIAPMSRQYGDSLILSSTHQLAEAVIADGELLLNWINETPLPVDITWTIPELSDADGAFSGEASFPPNGASQLRIPLAGLRYVSEGDLSSADVNVTIQSVGSSGQTIELSASDQVAYDLTWSNVRLASATGNLAATQIAAGPLFAAIDWDDGLEAAGLDDYEAFLRVSSSLPQPTQINGTITGNTGLELSVSGTIPAAGESPAFVRLPITHAPTILRPLPAGLSFSGTASMAGSDEPIVMLATDFVQAAIELSAPAHMYVDSVSLNVDPSSVSLSSDDFGDRTDRLLDATVEVSVANRFPLGGEFTLRVSRDSAGVNGPDALVFGPSTLLPAQTDASGNAIAPLTTELTYSLDSAALSVFEGEVVWFAESLTLLGPGNGQPARISAADVLNWNAQARMVVRVDSDVRPWEE